MSGREGGREGETRKLPGPDRGECTATSHDQRLVLCRRKPPPSPSWPGPGVGVCTRLRVGVEAAGVSPLRSVLSSERQSLPPSPSFSLFLSL